MEACLAPRPWAQNACLFIREVDRCVILRSQRVLVALEGRTGRDAPPCVRRFTADRARRFHFIRPIVVAEEGLARGALLQGRLVPDEADLIGAQNTLFCWKVSTGEWRSGGVFVALDREVTERARGT